MARNQPLLKNSFINEILEQNMQEPGSQSVSGRLIEGLESFGFKANTKQGLVLAREVFVNLPELTLKTRREIKNIFDSLIEDKYTFSEEQLLVQVYGERVSSLEDLMPVSSLEDLIKEQYPDYFYPYHGNRINFNKFHAIQAFCDELILQHKFSFEKRMFLEKEMKVAVFRDLPNMPTNKDGEQKFTIVDITECLEDHGDGISLNMLKGKTRFGEVDTDTTLLEKLHNIKNSHDLSRLSLEKFQKLLSAIEGHYQTVYPKETLNCGELAMILFGLTGYRGNIFLDTNKNTDKKQWSFSVQGLKGSFVIADASKDNIMFDPFKNDPYRIIFSD